MRDRAAISLNDLLTEPKTQAHTAALSTCGKFKELRLTLLGNARSIISNGKTDVFFLT
jgi:hypothetical protein